jgi:hypothetical protein
MQYGCLSPVAGGTRSTAKGGVNAMYSSRIDAGGCVYIEGNHPIDLQLCHVRGKG